MRTFREVLKSVLEDKKRVNPNYSLRTFAKYLGFSPPRLSMVLNGKRGISETAAEEISLKIGLVGIEKELFIASAIADAARSPVKRNEAQEKLDKIKKDADFVTLDQEHFKIISNWHHYAILELILTKDFKSEVGWIAKKLNTSPFEVQQCLDRLAENGMIKIEKGKIKSTYKSFTTTNEVPSKSVRMLNHDLLMKAVEALENQPIDARDFATLTIGIRKEKLHEFKSLLKNFRRELNRIAEDIPVEERDQVYVYTSSFYSLTHD